MDTVKKTQISRDVCLADGAVSQREGEAPAEPGARRLRSCACGSAGASPSRMDRAVEQPMMHGMKSSVGGTMCVARCLNGRARLPPSLDARRLRSCACGSAGASPSRMDRAIEQPMMHGMKSGVVRILRTVRCLNGRARLPPSLDARRLRSCACGSAGASPSRMDRGS